MVMDYPGISLLLGLVASMDVYSATFRVDLKKTVYLQNRRFKVINKAILFFDLLKTTQYLAHSYMK